MPQPCNRGQRLRHGVCCLPTTCLDQGFKACAVNNGTDVCSPCPSGYFIKGSYSTKFFEDSPCVEKPECFQEQLLNEEGNCECDRASQYVSNGNGDCTLTDRTCQEAGIELNDEGECTPCKDGYYKDTNTNAVCKKMRKLTCKKNQVIREGSATTDRQCVTAYRSTQVTTTYLHTGSTIIQSTGNEGHSTGTIYGVSFACGGLFLLVLLAVILFKWRSRKGSSVVNKGAVRDESAGNGVENEEREGLTTSNECADIVSEDDQSEDSTTSNESADVESAWHQTAGVSLIESQPTQVAVIRAEVHLPEHEHDSMTKNGESDDVKSGLNTMIEESLSYESGNYTNKNKPEAVPFSEDELRPRQPESDNNDNQTLHRTAGGAPLVAIVGAQVYPQEQTTQVLASPVTDDNGRLVNGPNSIPMPPRDENVVILGQGQQRADHGNPLSHGPQHTGNGAQLVQGLPYAAIGASSGQVTHHTGDSAPFNLNINAQGVDVVDDLSSEPYSTIRPSL